MSNDDLERLNHVAYSYRAWPATDPKGVCDRFNELVKFVNQLLENEMYDRWEVEEMRDE